MQIGVKSTIIYKTINTPRYIQAERGITLQIIYPACLQPRDLSLSENCGNGCPSWILIMVLQVMALNYLFREPFFDDS